MPGGHLRVIPGEQIATLHKDVAWPMTGGRDTQYPPKKLAQINKSLGAGLIITGAFADSGEPNHRQIRLDIQLLNASTGEILASLAETGNRDDLFTLAARAGADLREKLGLLQMSPADAQTTRAVLPANERYSSPFLNEDLLYYWVRAIFKRFWNTEYRWESTRSKFHRSCGN